MIFFQKGDQRWKTYSKKLRKNQVRAADGVEVVLLRVDWSHDRSAQMGDRADPTGWLSALNVLAPDFQCVEEKLFSLKYVRRSLLVSEWEN